MTVEEEEEEAFASWLMCESTWMVEKQTNSSGEGRHADIPIIPTHLPMADRGAQSGTIKGGLSAPFY